MKTSLLSQKLPYVIIALLSFLFFFQNQVFGQDCKSQVILILENINGGIYANQSVELKPLSGGKSYTATSDNTGTATFEVPCGVTFSIHISNYTRKQEITSPENPGSYAKRKFSYEPNMVQKQAYFAMNDTEKQQTDALVKSLPDTTRFMTGTMVKPVNMDPYVTYTISIKDLDDKPLVNETVIITGTKRGKNFKGKTNAKGQLLVYLPKGDEYMVHFLYQRDFRKQDVEYSKGVVNAGMNISYMGTAEYLRRKKAEEERIKAEEKRLLEEKLAFEKWCKEERISVEEGMRRRLKESSGSGDDQVVTKVLGRNKWSEKLIVCDLTGSMDPYANQLAAWYQLNVKLEPNLQFVFFNDGDQKSDAQKVIGKTGGIYYQKAKGLDSLIYLMSRVRANGNGGDCAENNMEALIKGVKMANPYKELVMIVDNNAPVKDISLLKEFNKPVHIVLCGANDGFVLEDYLLIAWKTKGSIHTMEEDLTKIAAMSEGETIVVGGIVYKIMGGQFVRITKS